MRNGFCPCWTFSPRLSLQVYAQPFIASGRYEHYKESADTHSQRFEDRFHDFAFGEIAINRPDEAAPPRPQRARASRTRRNPSPALPARTRQ